MLKSKPRKESKFKEGKTYVSWIRSEEKGKGMYISPSHNAPEFDNRNYSDSTWGLQYVAGDMPIK